MTNFTRKGDIIKIYESVAEIPGFFNYDDAQHFALLLRFHYYYGIKGDIMEIGTWKGRSAAFLSLFLDKTEKLFLIDVFSSPAIDKYPEYPSVDDVRNAILKFNPSADPKLVFIEGESKFVDMPNAKCRFIHLDGGHSFDECYSDLCKATPLIIPNGIICVDDYDHPDWQEVKLAADKWLSENQDFKILGDLNRAVAKGRKLYLLKAG